MKSRYLAVMIIILAAALLLISSTTNAEARAQKGDSNFTNPMIIYSESWNPFYGNDGGNATLTNVSNMTLKYNLLAPDKPYRMIQKNITLTIGDVELRKNGTIFKNCILEGNMINGDGNYSIMQFQLLNQTRTYEYYGDSYESGVNLTFQEYPNLPDILCQFTTNSIYYGLGNDRIRGDNDRIRNGNDLRTAIISETSLIWIILGALVIIATIIVLWKVAKRSIVV